MPICLPIKREHEDSSICSKDDELRKQWHAFANDRANLLSDSYIAYSSSGSNDSWARGVISLLLLYKSIPI